MNAVDDIRIRARVEHVTDTEAAEVIEWCREWDADTFAASDDSDKDIPALLRWCDKEIVGGIAFVLEVVRRVAAYHQQ